MKELSTRTFSRYVEKNPRECKAMTLRSGKKLSGSTLVEEDEKEPENEKEPKVRQKES